MRKPTSQWLPLINEYIAHWTEYGEDKQVAGKTLVQFQALADSVLAAIKTCEDLNHQAELAAARRDADAETLYSAMRAYNQYVSAMEGPNSDHAKTAPRLSKRTRASSGGSGALKPPTITG
jgi:hypothetical protein